MDTTLGQDTWPCIKNITRLVAYIGTITSVLASFIDFQLIKSNVLR